MTRSLFFRCCRLTPSQLLLEFYALVRARIFLCLSFGEKLGGRKLEENHEVHGRNDYYGAFLAHTELQHENVYLVPI